VTDATRGSELLLSASLKQDPPEKALANAWRSSVSRKVWMVFLSLQVAGIIFSWLSNYTLGPSPLLSGIGVGLRVSGFLLLFPGSLVAAVGFQRLLYHIGLSINILFVLGFPVAMATNLAIWVFWAKLSRSA
jgi:hypothetical protein